MFVCLSDESLSRALTLHLSLSGQSQVSLRSLLAYFIGRTEPKILCLFSSLWLKFSQIYSISPLSALSQSSISTLPLSTLVSEHTLPTLFDFILHYPRFPKGSLKLPNIVQRLHAVPRAYKQFYKLAVS